MFHYLVDFGGRYIHPNRKPDDEYSEICSKQIDKTVKSFNIKMVMMFIALQGAILRPAYAYFLYGTKTTMTNTKVPFTEKESNAEFIINFVLTSVIGVHGFIGYVGLEVAMALFSVVATIVPQIVDLEFRKLNEKLLNQSITKHQLCIYFRNIVRQSLDSDEYERNAFYTKQCSSIILIDWEYLCIFHAVF